MSTAPPATQPHQRIHTLAELPDTPLHLVLVEPEIPPNTGNVARLCAATGCTLHLVEPLGFRIDDRELKRAGLDYWDKLGVVMHPSLETFLIATGHLRRWYFSTFATNTYNAATFEYGDMLIFGKETKGLPKDLIAKHADFALRIPMRVGSVRSINLSTAVGIATYNALAQLGFPDLR
jgi:tRNA (cytidine/uridine-2'-O-)-methyltransferase